MNCLSSHTHHDKAGSTFKVTDVITDNESGACALELVSLGVNSDSDLH